MDAVVQALMAIAPRDSVEGMLAAQMVAAHNADLAAARAAGLQTAFVPRPTEHGPKQTTDLAPTEAWDFVAPDFRALAQAAT